MSGTTVSGFSSRTLEGLVNTKAMGKMAPVLIGLLTGLNEVEREMTRDRVMESIEHRKATGGSMAVARRPIRQRNAWCCACGMKGAPIAPSGNKQD